MVLVGIVPLDLADLVGFNHVSEIHYHYSVYSICHRPQIIYNREVGLPSQQ